MESNKAGIESSEICEGSEVVTVINSESISGIMDGGDDLPEWVLIEVFSKLHVKLVFRLKLVCKHWLSLISDPGFVRMYISRVSLLHPFQPWVIVSQDMVYDRRKCSYFIYDVLVDNIYTEEFKCPSYLQLRHPSTKRINFTVYGISNGLVLCAPTPSQPTHGANFDRTRIYKICNRATGQWISLPPLTSRFKNVYVGFLTQVEGGMLKSYRVVCLDWAFLGRNGTFHVFFSEIGEWKVFTASSDPEIEVIGTRPPTELDGNLHWVLRKGILAYDPDLKPDGLRITPLPGNQAREYNEARQGMLTPLCGVAGGKLMYLELSHSSSSVGVWKLDDYSSGNWSLQHRVVIRSPILYHKFSYGLLCFDPNDSDIVYLGRRDHIMSFNIKNETLDCHGHPLSDEDLSVSRFTGLLFSIPRWPISIPSLSLTSVRK